MLAIYQHQLFTVNKVIGPAITFGGYHLEAVTRQLVNMLFVARQKAPLPAVDGETLGEYFQSGHAVTYGVYTDGSEYNVRVGGIGRGHGF